MEKKDYRKLNGYLNDIFLALNRNDQFLINNLAPIAYLNDDYLKFMRQHKLSSKTKENKLTYMDVYLLSREIISSIDKSYLPEYDDLIKSGKLDFGYEGEYWDSEFVYKGNLININRKFYYHDVWVLVHEFMHYTNGKEKRSQKRYLLTEFFSIYFEMYAIDYLISRGVPRDEIGIFDRLNWTTRTSRIFESYETIFLAYEKFGDINEETVGYLRKHYFPNISKESFDKQCESLLSYIMKKEEEYRMGIMYEKEFKTEEFIRKFGTPAFSNYRYVLGTLMAFYARSYCKMEDIVFLNNHINDDDIGSLDLLEVLKRIGIDITNPEFIGKAFESIDSYIEQYSNEKNR